VQGAKASVHVEDKHKMTALHNASCKSTALLSGACVPFLALACQFRSACMVACMVAPAYSVAFRCCLYYGQRQRVRSRDARDRECA